MAPVNSCAANPPPPVLCRCSDPPAPHAHKRPASAGSSSPVAPAGGSSGCPAPVPAGDTGISILGDPIHTGKDPIDHGSRPSDAPGIFILEDPIHWLGVDSMGPENKSPVTLDISILGSPQYTGTDPKDPVNRPTFAPGISILGDPQHTDTDPTDHGNRLTDAPGISILEDPIHRPRVDSMGPENKCPVTPDISILGSTQHTGMDPNDPVNRPTFAPGISILGVPQHTGTDPKVPDNRLTVAPDIFILEDSHHTRTDTNAAGRPTIDPCVPILEDPKHNTAAPDMCILEEGTKHTGKETCDDVRLTSGPHAAVARKEYIASGHAEGKMTHGGHGKDHHPLPVCASHVHASRKNESHDVCHVDPVNL